MTDQKPYGPPPDAIPLSDAMKEYLPAEMWEAHARATEARKNAPKRPSYLSMSVREWEAANASYEAANRTRSARADLHRVWNGMLAARAEGVGSAITSVFAFRLDKVLDILQVPREEGWNFACCVTMGYPTGRWGVAPRRPVHEVSFRNTWGRPLGFEIPEPLWTPGE